MTSGGDQGLSGKQSNVTLLRDPRAITALAFAGFGLLYMAVNSASLIDQRRALGQPIAQWQAWVLEGTSFAAWLALLPVILVIATQLTSRPLPLAALGHAVGCIAVSLAHTALMASLRIAAYALAGEDYAPIEAWSERLLFEARKDLITYVSILAVFFARAPAGRTIHSAPSAAIRADCPDRGARRQPGCDAAAYRDRLGKLCRKLRRAARQLWQPVGTADDGGSRNRVEAAWLRPRPPLVPRAAGSDRNH